MNNRFEVNTSRPSHGVDFSTAAELENVALFRDYSETLLCFASVCCVLFMLVGIPGNFITIIALARNKKIRNATAIFIINLHISDIIFCCSVLPMTAMTFAQKRWTHGVIMCRLYPATKYVLQAISILTTLAITLNRYVIVCHPLMYPRLYKKRNITIMLIIIWLSAFALFLPSTLGLWGRFNLEPNGGFCTLLEDEHHRCPKKLFLIVAFVGPYLTIVLCYARIWWVVRKTAKQSQGKNTRQGNQFISFEPSINTNSITEEESIRNSSAASTPNNEKTLDYYFKAPFRLTKREVRPKAPTRRDKKLFTMIIAIMLCFCISHFPIMVTRLVYKEYKSEPIANVLAHLLAYLETCINPIIYVFMSNEYRKAYKSMFKSTKNKFQMH